MGIDKAGTEIETFGINGAGCFIGGGEGIFFYRCYIAVFYNDRTILIDAVGKNVDDFSVGNDGIGWYCSSYDTQ